MQLFLHSNILTHKPANLGSLIPFRAMVYRLPEISIQIFNSIFQFPLFYRSKNKIF